MWGEALDFACRHETGHRLDRHLDRFAYLQTGHISLVDLGIDDHGVEVGNRENFGAAVEAVGAGDGLTHRNRAGQHRAVEGCADFRKGQVRISDRQRALGAFERILRQLVGRLGVIVGLLRNELVGQQLLRALVVTFGLLQAQLGLFDVGEI